MKKRTVRDLHVKGKRVLIRVDFNVPLQKGVVADDTRILGALPTIQYLLDQGASVILLSHLGRPKGRVKPELSLRPVADDLAAKLGRPVTFLPDCVGEDVEAKAASLQPGEILLLENLRFHPEEQGKVKLAMDAGEIENAAARAEMRERQGRFTERLAGLGDVYVNDAFGTAHRAHASVSGVPERMPEAGAGFLLEKEIDYLGAALADPERPFVAILGGAKISGKIDVISHLLGIVDVLLIGGGMAYTFFRAQGHAIGNSIVEEDKIPLAREILEQAEAAGVRLLLPVDTVVADAFSETAHTQIVGPGGIEDGWEGLDIGPETRRVFAAEIAGAKTVVWNGPMGCFEMDLFAAGTEAVARAVAEADCISIIGGGDSASAIKKAGLADRMTHISTGGGASLEFLEGKALPGVTALPDAV